MYKMGILEDVGYLWLLTFKIQDLILVCVGLAKKIVTTLQLVEVQERVLEELNLKLIYVSTLHLVELKARSPLT